MTNEFWFKPKTFGYGAVPTTWEGWALTGVYVAIVSACVVAMMVRKGSISTFVSSIAVIAVSTIVLIVVSVQKTEGAWGWNAGAHQVAGKKN
jgi:signal transduction histidine kinase